MTPPVARCIDCNYPLYQINSSNCPECGRAFNPERPGTMNLTGKPIGSGLRFLLRPVLWPLNVLALAVAVWTVWLFRWPDEAVRSTVWNAEHVFLIWLAMGCIWGGLLTTMLMLIQRKRRMPGALHKQRISRWLVFPVMGLVCWGLVANDVGFKLFWWHSRPALEEWALHMHGKGQALRYPDRWVGSFWAKRIYTDGTVVGFDLTDGSEAWSILHVPGEAGALNDDFSYWRQIEGAWYVAQRRPPVGGYPVARLRMLTALARDRSMAGRSMRTLIASLADDALTNVGAFYEIPAGLRRLPGEARPARRVLQGSGAAGGRFPLRPDVAALISLGPEAAPNLKQALTSPIASVRYRAACVLGEMGPAAADAAPALVLLLADKEFAIRDAAAYALGEFGEPLAASALVQVLADPNVYVRYDAVMALRKLGADPAPCLNQVRSSLNACMVSAIRQMPTSLSLPYERRAATWENLHWLSEDTARELIEFITPLGPDAAVVTPQLIVALSQDQTRQVANELLQRIGPAADAALEQAVKSDDAALAPAAAAALGNRASAGLIRELVERYCAGKAQPNSLTEQLLIAFGARATPLLEQSLNDPQLKQRVARLLAKSDPARAELYVPVVLETMNDVQANLQGIARGGATDVRPLPGESAAPLLRQEIGFYYAGLGPESIPYLVRTLRRDSSRTVCIMDTLGHMGEAAAPALAELIGDGNLTIRRLAYERLIKLGPLGKKALPALVAALKDPNAEMRYAALQAIEAIGPDQSDLKAIGGLIEDESPTVRREAKRILAE